MQAEISACNVTSLTVDPTEYTDGGNIKVKFSFDEKQNIQPGDYLLDQLAK